jgi:hypothetical protein
MPATATPRGRGSDTPQALSTPSRWFFSKNGQRHGPVLVARFKQMIQSGELAPDDRVFGEGMKDWAYVHEVQDRLADVPLPVPVLPAPPDPNAPPPPTIEYYRPERKLWPRAQRVLKDLPAPTGDHNPSPLSDVHLGELQRTARHDRALRQFGVACNVAALATVVFGVLPSVLVLVMMYTYASRASRSITSFIVTLVAGCMISALVYATAARAALRCRLWGPIAVLALSSLHAVFLVERFGRIFRLGGVTFFPFQAYIPLGIALLLLAYVIFASIRALRAIPGFVASPVWCQEALIVARS